MKDWLKYQHDDMPTWLSKHEREDLPEWLSNYIPGCALDLDSITSSRCVYYPGAGSDGMPVEVCNRSHSAHLYIYADYMYGDESFYPDGLKVKARRYNIIDRRPLFNLSDNSWTPHVSIDLLRDGSPDNNHFGPYTPYFELVVYERDAALTDKYGAQRFAVIFCTYDGIALYDILFGNNVFKNLFLLLLQDHGLGGNYSSFRGLMHQIAINANVFPKYCIAQKYSTDYDGVWEGYELLPCESQTSYTSGRTRYLYKKTAESHYKQHLLNPHSETITGKTKTYVIH